MVEKNNSDNPRRGGQDARRFKLFDWSQVKWMGGLALRHPGRCATLLVLNLMMLGLVLSGLGVTGTLVDEVSHAVDATAPVPKWPWGIARPESWATDHRIAVLGGTIIGVALLVGSLRLAITLTLGRLVQEMVVGLRSAVYAKLQRLHLKFYDTNETGSIINRGTGDVNNVAGFAQFAAIDMPVLLITLTTYFLYMLSIHWKLAMVALATTPVLAGVSTAFSRMVRPAYERNRKLYDKVILAVSEDVQGKHVVKGFALEPRQVEKFRAANDEYRGQQRWIFKRMAAYTSTVQALMQVNTAVVLLVGGAIIIGSRGQAYPPLTVGKLVIFLSLLSRFSGQVNAVTNVANTLQLSLTAARRVREVIDAPLGIADVPDAKPVQRSKGEVVFEDVSFAYGEGEPVLRGVSFRAAPGQCVAILGATGSGKTTLLSLITRFQDPTNGRVLLDGEDLRALKLDDLRRNMGIVFQESFLFSNTVAANIAFGCPQATREEIERAAKIAQAHDFVMELPNGYDTVIGEQGNTLSGGQRQRLALARAILLEPPILVLDDATAAIDPETEHEIMTAIDTAMTGRTTFVVAHRLSTLRRADVVLVLDRGRIVERGTHEELIEREGHYADVARRQAADEESQYIIQAARWIAGEVETPLLLEREESL